MAHLIVAAELLPFPDAMTRAGIWYLCRKSRKAMKKALKEKLARSDKGASSDSDFARQMSERPIAIHTDKANEQHYEVPAEFFALCLGPHRKYSCCLFDTGGAAKEKGEKQGGGTVTSTVTSTSTSTVTSTSTSTSTSSGPTVQSSPLKSKDTLEEAERRALQETCVHAQLQDGQRVLEMGCGWGSLSLWMAQAYPLSRITAVSNSNSQRQYIEATAASRGLTNLTVITCDMNAFSGPADPSEKFDRIVSVEMFEHMSNWAALLTKARSWIKPETGRMFIHVFSHKSTPYIFDENDKTDWIAQHFFTGGIMPSHELIRQYSDLFQVEEDWVWNGEHYAQTAEKWLENFDKNEKEITRVLTPVYGKNTKVWKRRWRLFYLATSGLFGHAKGAEWQVSHYRLKPADA